ncbi:MAG: ABC-F family ATP-binding cassette domain-containing protein [Flavobacteriales bacterium]|jgi:ABC transport system ATP-binding/permease protein|nr:ABC-F family ATP-binding cassette domain-containing protein [Flavobacteriales bacterium]
MNLLSVEKLGKNFGERILFENLSFGLSKGDKMALIANNGTGKSSMLKILSGDDIADSGKVVFRNECKISYLSQDVTFNNDITINELINSAHNKISLLVKAYEQAVYNNSDIPTSYSEKLVEDLTAEMDKNNAWDYQRRSKQILSKFNINDFSQKVGILSGGQKKRLALALLLLENADILLLDEPTNHLDITMIEWLEKYLQQQNITLLMVTHDRYFLERVCNHIIELEAGNLYHHKGNYAYFLEKRSERESNFDVEIAKAQKLMKKELEWIRRSPKARTTKSKARIDNFNKIKLKATSKRITKELNIDVKMDRIGGKILELKNIKKSYDSLIILDGFDYTFKKGERIGILGKNGVGKSTFLNIITGLEKVDSGKINLGETINYGYFTQLGLEIDEERRVIQILKDIAEFIVMSDGKKVSASQLLEHFMFTPEMQFTQVKRLSGGERRRLHLLTVLMKNPNFLILDEPTNDLDLLTLTKLEEFLLQYKGCLILVSHDRFFMDKLTEHLFVFKGNGIIEDYYCSYSEYRAQEIKEEKEFKKIQHLEKENSKLQSQRKKLSFNEKYEYDNLEKELVDLENERKKLECDIQNINISTEKMIEISTRLGVLVNMIDEKELRWLELDEKNNIYE